MGSCAIRHGGIMSRNSVVGWWELENAAKKIFRGLVWKLKGDEEFQRAKKVLEKENLWIVENEKEKLDKEKFEGAYNNRNCWIWAVQKLKLEGVISNCQSNGQGLSRKHDIFINCSDQANWNDDLENSNGTMMPLTHSRQMAKMWRLE